VTASKTTYSDLTALNYETIYYRVIAVNEDGLSPPSNEVLALPKDFSAQILPRCGGKRSRGGRDGTHHYSEAKSFGGGFEGRCPE
ncbi:MAG: hypothetical protein O7F56_07495, partial [Acidobacteria bacterium]|nr:hypothetical protein [Acidobacteriota bacterium]